MPTYSYQCSKCQLEEERFNVPSEERDRVPCPKCGHFMSRPFRKNLPKFDANGPCVLEHAEERPMAFSSRTAADRYLKKKGLVRV